MLGCRRCYTVLNMLQVPIYLIAAVARNGVIGAADRLPWRLPDDLDYFFRKTAGGTCIIGRKAFLGVPKQKFLNGRRVIVLTRDVHFKYDSVVVAHSVEEALTAAGYDGRATWVCGGGEIYKLFEPLASRAYLTEVATEAEGDVTFAFDKTKWHETLRAHHDADDKHAHAFDFVVYERAVNE